MIVPSAHPFLISLLRAGDRDACMPSASDAQTWELIARDAAAQGLTSLLYRWLKTSGTNIPPPVMDRIKTSSFRLAARNLALIQEAASILQSFERRRIPCAPVRGPVLAELLHGESTARPMGDLDFLVRKEDLDEVADTLAGLGFQERDRRPGFARTYSNSLEFLKERHGWVIVEPHWTLAYPPFADRIDMHAVWTRCRRGQALSDLLLHLCLHLIHRGDSAPLLWLYELDVLIRQGDIAWPRIIETVKEAGLGLFVSEVLARLEEVLDSPVPDQVFAQLRADRPREDRLLHLLAGESRADGKESLALLFMIQGLRPKVRYMAALLFPSVEFMRLNYGLSNWSHIGLYYVTRITRFAWEAMKGIGGMLRRHPDWTF
jgi:hypothetical protein